MSRPPPRSPWLKLGFGLLVALILVSGLVFLAESTCRWLGLGHESSFAREDRDVKGGKVWRENRWVTAPYFPPALVRRPVPFVLPQVKAPRTYRVFVLGSSAAMGDPEPAFGVARVTEELLRAAYPDVRFEVVNAAITAVNSHVVRQVAADCARLQPDAFFVYEGNNEVIGPYGPGTVFSPSSAQSSWIRLLMGVHQSRIGQAWRARRSTSEVPPSWGGLKMFLPHVLAASDARLSAVEANFSENLQAIAKLGREAGARVWLSTVLVNQRDFAPFYSVAPTFSQESDRGRWQTALDGGRTALRERPLPEAVTWLREAAELAPHHAESLYLLSRALREQGSIQEADTLAARAVDEDGLRFRTDSRLNGAIRRAAVAAGVGLIDAEALARGTPEGLGDGLLYEHVHLNMQGTYLVARALAEAIGRDLAVRGLGPAAPAAWSDLATVRRSLAYSPYEQVLILHELLDRLRQPPFVGRWGNEQRLQDLARREQQIRSVATRADVADAQLALYEDALRLRSDDAVLWRNYGSAATALGRLEKGATALDRSLAIHPDDTDALAAALAAARALGQGEREREFAERLRRLEPEHPGLRVFKK